MRGAHLRRVVVALLVAGGLGLASGSALAAPADEGWSTLDDLELEAPDQAQRDQSIIRYSAEDTVRSLETVEDDAGEMVVNLASDILFSTDEAELPEQAPARIAELLEPLPSGANLAVHGHTDSVASDAYNLELSQRRADAVAAAVRAARPDLVLDVRGFGETAPKVPEGGADVAEDRSVNRRVELRYRR